MSGTPHEAKRPRLEPCPFCGSEEVYVEEYEHHPGAARWRVLCAGCMAGIDTGTRQSAGAAVQDWNRRAERTFEQRRTRRTCRYVRDHMGVAGNWFCKCSECGAEFDERVVDRHFVFCPECGAKVVGE